MKDKLNIFMATEVFTPDLFGGGGRYIFEVAKALVRQGNTVSIVVKRCKPGLPAKEHIDGIKVYRYGKGMTSWKNSLSDFLHGALLSRKVFNSGTFDVCHIFQPYSGFLVLLCSSVSCPFIYNFFSPWHEEFLVNRYNNGKPGFKPGYWFRFIIERYVINKSNKVTVLSDYSLNQVSYYHKAQAKCIKTPGGVDIQRFAPPLSKIEVKQKMGFSSETFLLFCIRWLRPRMGLFSLLEAMNVLRKKIPDIKLLLGGKGPLYHKINEFIATKKLEEHVSLLGQVPDEMLPQYYQMADLFVLPTEKLEGFGLISLESFACGTPVVATPIGANIEIVGGIDKQLLTDSTSPESLARSIEEFYNKWKNQQYDSCLYRNYALGFSWDNIGKRVYNCYVDTKNII